MDVGRMNAILGLDQLTKPLTLEPKADPQTPSFGTVLDQAMQKVEQDQKTSDEAALQLASGQTNDITGVMIASEKASLSLDLTVQVRNKLLEAYQEIIRMPL